MRSRGISLVEILITLVIAGVLLRIALPAFGDFIAGQRAVAAINGVIGSVQLARSRAVTGRTTVIFCPRREAICGSRSDWSNGGWIFADQNRNAELDENEPVIGSLPPMPAGATLTWRAFRNRAYLRFLPTGLTDWQNGHFLYCPANADARFARVLILNAQGRVRVTRDTDGDGIAEDAGGSPLEC